MTCREVSEFLRAYVMDELGADLRVTFDAHIAECSNCRAYLQQYQETRELGVRVFAQTDATADAPHELVDAILRSLATLER
jgi:anti-sigma factor RsiW